MLKHSCTKKAVRDKRQLSSNVDDLKQYQHSYMLQITFNQKGLYMKEMGPDTVSSC